jgi:hypothetical protein
MIDRIKDLHSNLLDIQASGKAQVIFRYYGHADNVEFAIYIPKWEYKKEPDYQGEFYLDGIKGKEGFTKSEEIVKLLKKVLCNEQVNITIDNSPTIVHEYTYSRSGTTAWDVTNNG